MITISVQPASVICKVGGTVHLSVTAASSLTNPALTYQWYIDDKVITSATSSSYSFTATYLTTGIYYCTITDSALASSVSSTCVVASTINDYIEYNLKKSIEDITISSGYNFDWSIVNELDIVIGDFPRANIIQLSESNLDLVSGVNSQTYTNDINFTIVIKGQQAWTDDPNNDVRRYLYLAIDDLKHMFAVNNSVNGSCDEIMYRSSRIVEIKKNDIQRPAEAVTTWLVKYCQDRCDPTMYASS